MDTIGILSICFCGSALFITAIVTLTIVIAVRLLKKNNPLKNKTLFSEAVQDRIESATASSQISQVKAKSDKFNTPQRPLSHISYVDFGKLVGIRVNDSTGFLGKMFPDPDRLLLVPTEIVNHRHSLELIIPCNGFLKWDPIYFIIPNENQKDKANEWYMTYLEWMIEAELPIEYIMTVSKGLESQAKAYSSNPGKSSIKDDILSIVKSGTPGGQE